jgi:hypothetical protein
MSLFDLFRQRRIDPYFGELIFRHGGYDGHISLSEFQTEPIRLRIETDPSDDLVSFRKIYELICSNHVHIKSQIERASYETYRWNVNQDKNAGNFTDEDYADYPDVASVADIWSALTPFAFSMTSRQIDYNWSLALDVFWPNPHYFIAQFRDLQIHALHVDG